MLLEKIKYKLKSKYQSTILRRPKRVILEMTNRCNLNCPYCMVGMQNDWMGKYGSTSHDLMTRTQGTMDEKIFTRAAETMKDFGITYVYMHFQGEPFLNSKMPNFSKILKDQGFGVGVFTNGLAFGEKNIKEIAEAEIDLIRFSVDGASQETYAKNRVGGNFDKLLVNMDKVVKAHEGKKTRIEWQFLPMKNNEAEVEKAKKIAEDLGVHFFLKGFRPTDPELLPDNEEYRATFLKKPCKDIYGQLGIYWNGDVVPCCYDTDGKEIMGNIMERDLIDIWEGEKYKSLRFNIDNTLNDPNNDPEICKSCLRWK
jgi:radical SAM protein with 4Fe4S-binding SPASM domain